MKTILRCVGILLLCASSVRAEGVGASATPAAPDTRDKAARLVAASGLDLEIAEVVDLLVKRLKFRKAAPEMIIDLARAELKTERFVPAYAQTLRKQMSEREIDAALAFFASPPGRRKLEARPALQRAAGLAMSSPKVLAAMLSGGKDKRPVSREPDKAPAAALKRARRLMAVDGSEKALRWGFDYAQKQGDATDGKVGLSKQEFKIVTEASLDGVARAYVDKLSEEDIKAATSFYGSGAGKSYQKAASAANTEIQRPALEALGEAADRLGREIPREDYSRLEEIGEEIDRGAYGDAMMPSAVARTAPVWARRGQRSFVSDGRTLNTVGVVQGVKHAGLAGLFADSLAKMLGAKLMADYWEEAQAREKGLLELDDQKEGPAVCFGLAFKEMIEGGTVADRWQAEDRKFHLSLVQHELGGFLDRVDSCGLPAEFGAFLRKDMPAGLAKLAEARPAEKPAAKPVADKPGVKAADKAADAPAGGGRTGGGSAPR